MYEDIEIINNILSLTEKISKKNSDVNTLMFDKVNYLSSSFIGVYKHEKSKLPYHINVIDLLWADENAHSRIFAELLKQNSGNKFEILEYFYDLLHTQISIFDKKPIQPKITSEKDRIDLLILHSDYAIIIENKIHGATDQDRQIARYIDKVKAKGFNEKNIWIVYLTKYGGLPEKQSWGDYEDSFKQRFFRISFRKDILPWLENSVLPNSKIKDVFLKSALEQYIDHLNGIFNLRTIQNNMNRELQDHIKKEFELTSDPEKDHKVLIKKLKEIQKVEGYISEMLLNAEKICWQKWLNQLKTDFPNYQAIHYSFDGKLPKVGIILRHKGVKFSALIEKDSNIYFGFGRHNSSETLNTEILELLKPLVGDFKETQWWYGWKYTSFENAYKNLKELIDSVIPKLEN